MLFSWISSFHSKEWTGSSITQINQKFNNFYAREIWGASNSNLRSGGPSLLGIEISEREERLIEHDRRLYHSYSTYPKHFRAFSKSLIPCSWLKETDKRIYKLSSTKLNPRSRFEDRGSKIPGEVQPFNGLYGEAPPKRGTFFRIQAYERVYISLVEV